MDCPQIGMIVIMTIDIVLNFCKEGEPAPPHSVGSAVLRTIFYSILLYYGGFWG